MYCCTEKQEHTHEFLGSTRLAELKEDPHNHRHAGISGPAIKVKGGHIHKIVTRTDFYEDHFHEIIVFTGLQIDVGEGRHVHFVDTQTTVVDGHCHDLIFALLIQDPISEEA